MAKFSPSEIIPVEIVPWQTCPPPPPPLYQPPALNVVRLGQGVEPALRVGAEGAGRKFIQQ